MRYLLDADTAIDHETQQYNLLERIPTLGARDLALVATTLIELYTGFERGPDPRRAELRFRRFLRWVTVIPLNQKVIRATAHLRVELLNRKLPIKQRAYDLIVAATALEYDLIVVSSNTREYRDIPGLHQFDPRTRQLLTH